MEASPMALPKERFDIDISDLILTFLSQRCMHRFQDQIQQVAETSLLERCAITADLF